MNFIIGKYKLPDFVNMPIEFLCKVQLNENEMASVIRRKKLSSMDLFTDGQKVTMVTESNSNVLVGAYIEKDNSFYFNSMKLFKSNINESDKKSLSKISKKYDWRELVEAIDEYEDDTVISDKETVLNYIMRLEGYMIRAKELHWSAETKSGHELIDEIRDKIEDLEDSIAEDMMGYLGVRITVGEVKPIETSAEDITTFLTALYTDTMGFYSEIKNNVNCIGIVSELESFLHELNKGKYLKELV